MNSCELGLFWLSWAQVQWTYFCGIVLMFWFMGVLSVSQNIFFKMLYVSGIVTYVKFIFPDHFPIHVILSRVISLFILIFLYRFLAHNRMLVASLCNHDLSVSSGIIVVVIVVVVCEHSSWPHAWPNKVHTLHAHAAISCTVAHQKLYHSDLYLLYSSHICMFILMSIVHEVINIATSNLTETCI